MDPGTGPTVGLGGTAYGPLADPTLRLAAGFYGVGALAGALTIVLSLAGVDELLPIPIAALVTLLGLALAVISARSILTRVSVDDIGLARQSQSQSGIGAWQVPWGQVETMFVVQRSVPTLVVIPRSGPSQRPITEFWLRKRGLPSRARSTPLPDDARRAIEARFGAPLPER